MSGGGKFKGQDSAKRCKGINGGEKRALRGTKGWKCKGKCKTREKEQRRIKGRKRAKKEV